jgi:transcriptional regulator GlxA family with amidase domain
MSDTPMTTRITLLALEGCFASNVIGFIDLLHIANMVTARDVAVRKPPFEWNVLSLDGNPVRASNGCMIAVDGHVARQTASQVVVIPAFGSAQAGALIESVKRHSPLLPWMRAQYDAGATLAATCSGTFLLAESGILDGKPATTSWWLAGAFAERYPKVKLDLAAMITRDNRLLCSGAGMSHFDLALHLIERFAGRDVARACARYAVLDDQRRSQAPFMILDHARSYDPLITRAERWMKANLRHNFGVAEIAAQLAVSPRTLDRRFKQCTGDSPQMYIQKLRVEAGKALLENTNLRMSDVLERIGYEDESTFRRLFKRHTTLSPRDYRRRFGVARGYGD